MSPRSTGVISTCKRPASRRDRSRRSVASFVRRSTWSRISVRNSRLVGSSMSSSVMSSTWPPSAKWAFAARGRRWRWTRVARARASRAARACDRKPGASSPSSSALRIHHGLVEAAAGDPVRGPLEPVHPPREDPREEDSTSAAASRARTPAARRRSRTSETVSRASSSGAETSRSCFLRTELRPRRPATPLRDDAVRRPAALSRPQRDRVLLFRGAARRS